MPVSRERQATMTRGRVREQLITVALGYVAGLGALLLWPQRDQANQEAVWPVGVVILLVTMTVADLWLFDRRPSLGPLRPVRDSWPNFVGLFGAAILTASLRSSALPERGLVTYAVGALMILGGVLAANLTWARDLESRRSDIAGQSDQ